MNSYQKKDLENIWHPCSQMKDYESFLPVVIESGKGVYLKDVDGNEYLDAVSSWWVNLFGHANERINKALYDQANTLEHVIFANFTHKPGIELSERILKVAPEGLSKIFFGDNGSSAVEIALKIAFQYYQQIGKKEKTRFIALTDAYHGETIGALSLGGCDLYSKIYKPLLLDVERVQGPDCYRCPYGKELSTCEAECFEHMEKVVSEGSDSFAAVIVEPMVQAAAGMKMYSPKYLEKLRALCTQYDVQFIADEIAVGFGRTGKMFACEHADVSPDLMCVSKGLTAGYMPLSLVLMKYEIYDAFYDDYVTMKAFLHSHSYSGNPLGCAVAVETLKIFEEDKVMETIASKADYLRSKVELMIENIPNVGEYRQIGMVGAIELVKDKCSKESFPWEDRVGYHIYQIALSKGVLLRPLGNIIYFMPPYTITQVEMDQMVDAAGASIIEYFASLGTG